MRTGLNSNTWSNSGGKQDNWCDGLAHSGTAAALSANPPFDLCNFCYKTCIKHISLLQLDVYHGCFEYVHNKSVPIIFTSIEIVRIYLSSLIKSCRLTLSALCLETITKTPFAVIHYKRLLSSHSHTIISRAGAPLTHFVIKAATSWMADYRRCTHPSAQRRSLPLGNHLQVTAPYWQYKSAEGGQVGGREAEERHRGVFKALWCD